MNNPSPKDIVNAIAMIELARGFGRYIVWIVMALYLYQVRGLSPIEVGAIYVIAGMASSPLTLAGGRMIDRIGRRPFAILLPIILGITFGLLFIFMWTDAPVIEILPAFIALSPLSSLQYVNDGAIVSDASLQSERMESFSKTRIYANVGIGLGLLAGGIISGINFSYVFIVTLATAVIEEYIYLMRVPETQPQGYSRSNEALTPGKRIPVYSDRIFIAFAVTAAVSSLAFSQWESPMTPIFLESVYKFPIFFITILYAVNTMVVVFVQRPINTIFNKMRDGDRIALGLMIFSISYLVIGLVSSFAAICAAVVLLTLGENVLVPALTTVVSKIAPAERRGTYFGFSSMVSSFISPFTPLLGTFLLSFFSGKPLLIWGTISAMGVIIGLAFATGSGRIHLREEEVAEAETSRNVIQSNP